MGTPVIVSGARTAVGSFGGTLKTVPVQELGALAIRSAVKRAGLRPVIDELSKKSRPTVFGEYERTEIHEKHYDYQDCLKPMHFDECIMGCVLQGGLGQNVGRQASIFGGLPEETPAITVNKVCASGMKAVALAAQAIKAGDAKAVVAGGMESMSTAPYVLPKARWGYRMDMPQGSIIDMMVHDGIWEIFNGYHMGNTAENIARKMGISREEQDELGVMSHTRALAAIREGRFAREIVPVEVPQRKKDPILFDVDERPMETSLEKMAKLRPAFAKDG
ncbi:MAG: thiolase family protein, partial [Planctomycetota bacterium]